MLKQQRHLSHGSKGEKKQGSKMKVLCFDTPPLWAFLCRHSFDKEAFPKSYDRSYPTDNKVLNKWGSGNVNFKLQQWECWRTGRRLMSEPLPPFTLSWEFSCFVLWYYINSHEWRFCWRNILFFTIEILFSHSLSFNFGFLDIHRA